MKIEGREMKALVKKNDAPPSVSAVSRRSRGASAATSAPRHYSSRPSPYRPPLGNVRACDVFLWCPAMGEERDERCLPTDSFLLIAFYKSFVLSRFTFLGTNNAHSLRCSATLCRASAIFPQRWRPPSRGRHDAPRDSSISRRGGAPPPLLFTLELELELGRGLGRQ